MPGRAGNGKCGNSRSGASRSGASGTAKFTGVLVGLIAAFAVRKLLSAGWKAATGSEPPSDPRDPEVRLGSALAWAALIGTVPELAKVIAFRATARNAAAKKLRDCADRDG